MDILSGRIKELRLKNNVTQKKVAEVMEIQVRSYKWFEHGKYETTLKKVEKLADFFNVSVDYLLGRTDNPEINVLPQNGGILNDV